MSRTKYEFVILAGNMQSILGPLSKSLAIASLVCMTMSLGLEVTWRQFLALLRDNGLLCRVLAANLLLVPLLGLALAKIFHMPLDFAIAFLLLAAAPGAPMALRYTRSGDDDAPFATALQLTLILAAICFTALIAELILPVQTRLSVPYDRVAIDALLYMVFPGLIGIAIQRWREEAVMIRKATFISARVFFLAWVILVTAEQSRAVRQLGIPTLAAMVLLIMGSMVIGWFLGGPQREKRRILATGTSMRNVALCAVIAIESFPGTKVDVAIVAFSALMVTPNSFLLFYENYRKKRRRALGLAS
jgi:predicted Na+-dependent transporter